MKQLEIFQKINSIPTKKDIIKFIELGNLDVMDFITSRKIISNTSLAKGAKSKANDEFEAQIRDLVLEQMGENKTFICNGFEVTKSEVGTTYDFSNDIIHCEIKEEIKELTAKLKQHETLLKNIDNDITAPPTYLTSSNTGEQYKAVKVTAQSTSSYKIMKHKKNE